MFQGLISLDLASHYTHMYATLSMGGAGMSHKKVDAGRSWILKQYYSNNVSRIASLRLATILVQPSSPRLDIGSEFADTPTPPESAVHILFP